MKRKPQLWRTKFARFISTNTVRGIVRYLHTQRIPITKHAVYNWVSGFSTPSSPVARALTRMSGGSVTLEDMHRHRETVDRIRTEMPTPPTKEPSCS